MIPYLSKGQGNIAMDSLKDLEEKNKIVYCSEAIKKILHIVNKASGADSSVLIYGKSGTGKEMIARSLHERSYRVNRPFVVINCNCLSEGIVDSELFGHEKGAFTGAERQKIGLLEKANGGTLVLDEIGDLKIKTQAKLLRFLQENEIYRVGGKTPISLNVRVISSTNKDLSKEVLEGRFREDLYYRINTIMITVPSLSERSEDIPLLLKHFLGKNVKIEKDILDILLQYDWPGNVRELKNLCERFSVFQDGDVITKKHLPENFGQEEKKSEVVSYDPSLTLADMNKIYILGALQHFTSKREAAKALGITVKTLYNRLHVYDAFEEYAIHSPVSQQQSV